MPYLKAFLVFNVLETCRVYSVIFVTIDLEIVKFIKIHNMRNVFGRDQITCKNYSNKQLKTG